MSVVYPDQVLPPKRYIEYRNVRGAAWILIIWGIILSIYSITLLTSPPPPNPAKPNQLPDWALHAMNIGGSCCCTGGIAILLGRRSLAWFCYLTACIYFFVFPTGTIVAVVIFQSLSSYFDSLALLKAAAPENRVREELPPGLKNLLRSLPQNPLPPIKPKDPFDR